MRRNKRMTGVLVCALLGAACSGPPKIGPAGAVVPVSHPATTGTTDNGAEASRHAPALVNASLVRQGYRVVKRGDQVLYCRSQSVTGTAFSSTLCQTESQIRERDAAVQRSRDTLNQPRITPCVGIACGGG
jgi:hypothetical protein